MIYRWSTVVCRINNGIAYCIVFFVLFWLLSGSEVPLMYIHVMYFTVNCSIHILLLYACCHRYVHFCTGNSYAVETAFYAYTYRDELLEMEM